MCVSPFPRKKLTAFNALRSSTVRIQVNDQRCKPDPFTCLLVTMTFSDSLSAVSKFCLLQNNKSKNNIRRIVISFLSKRM